jgi:hypothetical protein
VAVAAHGVFAAAGSLRLAVVAALLLQGVLARVLLQMMTLSQQTPKNLAVKHLLVRPHLPVLVARVPRRQPVHVTPHTRYLRPQVQRLRLHLRLPFHARQ